jgi:putative endonuclease
VKTFYVYIMASKTGTLYTGLTSNIKKRVWEHKNHVVPGFSDKYKTERLLYYETIGDSLSAIGREKQIKNWRREKKVKLIEIINPQWADLSCEWYDKRKDD